MSYAAAIHVRPLHKEGDAVVAAAVGTEVVFLRRIQAESGFDVRATLIDAFLAARSHHPGDLVVYVPDGTVRQLLAEAAYPGVEVRSWVAGPRLAEAWAAASAAIAQVQAAESAPAETAPDESRAHRVIATDASKQKNVKLTGIAAVTSTGTVKTATLPTSSVLEGEFAAIELGLKQVLYSRTAREVDILTDSLKAATTLGRGARRRGAGDRERSCLRMLDRVRGRGIEVRVSWVRGHAGNPLNELADRAAVVARRCGQWDQPHDRFLDAIRAELRLVLEQTDPVALVPLVPAATVAV